MKYIITLLSLLFTINISYSQSPPVASNVSAATVKNTNASIHLVASDADFDSLTYSIVSNPSNGTVSLSGDIVTYTPTTNYTGTDTFTFKANDGASDSATKTVTITVISGYKATQTQIGADIDGEAVNDYSGISVSFNEDGTTLAIGAYANDGTASNAGHVRVYSWNGSAWTKLGDDIDGEAANDYFGNSVSLSSDGTTIAIGASQNDNNRGHVRVYSWNGSVWTKLGDDIDGETASDFSGYSVSLSSDGTTVAIGAYQNNGNGTDAGHVRVYSWNGSAWTKQGGDIDGEAAGDYSGYSVSLSSDGTTVAIGAFGNDGTANGAGHVRVYSWNGSAWTKLGDDIDGEAALDSSGSVSLSSDGTTVAIGAYNNDGSASNAGHVRVYSWNGSAWTKLGDDIDGEAANDYFGNSVSLSSDGTILAIGAYANDGNGNNSGHVRVYSWNGSVWTKLGDDIDGETASDFSGYSVSLSSDGTTVAIGAYGNDGTASIAGHVRVYNLVNDTNSPVAVDDTLTVLEDASLTSKDVIANDTDVDGDTLSLTAVTTAGTGTVAINSDGVSVDYTPAANFNGTEVITYTVSDGTLTDATGTLTITVTAVNDAPVAVDDTLTVLEDASLTSKDVIANDTDVDGDTLSLTAVTTAGTGTVAINSDGVSVDYTPAANFNGTEVITYTVSDGTLTDATGTLTVTVTAVNDAPVAVANTLTVLEDAALTSTDVIANDTDIDGDTLSLTAVTTAGTGTVAINADGVSVDYTPAANFNGTEVITYTVSDGTLTDATGTLTITVNTNNYTINVTASSSANYTLSGTDFNGAVSGNDPNLTFYVGDQITFAVNASNHPFYIKTVAGTGTGNQASNVTNNGTESGNVVWTPTEAGTYYYQCSAHAGMVGTITIASNSNLSGTINNDTTWALSGSPYTITGNVLVSSGVTLTIQPGVVINFSDDFKILVKGNITSSGTSGSLITFNGNSSEGSNQMIIFKSTNLSNSTITYNVFNGPQKAIQLADESEGSEDSTKNSGILTVTYSDFNNAGLYTKGYSTSAELKFENSTFDDLIIKGYYPRSEPITFTNCVINNSSIDSDAYNLGINVISSTIKNSNITMGCCSAKFLFNGSIVYNSNISNGMGSPVNGLFKVVNSFFVSSSINLPSSHFVSEKSIFFSKNSASDMLSIGNTEISNSSFIGYDKTLSSTGIKISGRAGYNIGGNTNISYSTLLNFNSGLVFDGKNTISIANNNILSNSLYNVKNNTSSDLILENNYWGTSNEAEIQNLLYDSNEDVDKGTIDYTPFSTALNTTAPISPPSNVTKSVSGSDVVLNWSANGESDIAGYKLHYGSPTGYSYSTTVDLGNVTTYTVTGGDIVTEYAITAYDSDKEDDDDDMVDGNESWFSVSKEVKVTLSTSATIIAEPSGSATLTATLDNTSSADVVVNLTYTGTATNATDYSGAASITISAGSLTGTTAITAIDDTDVELTETIIIDMGTVSGGAENGTQQVTINLTDNDLPSVSSIAVDKTSIDENGGVAVITATISAAQSKDVTIPLTITGTATNATDYSGAASITIPAGSTTGSITFTGIQDSNKEDDETIIITPSTSPTNATSSISDAIAITIVDENFAPVATPQTDVAATEQTEVTITLAGTDFNDDTLTYIVSTLPTNGTLSDNGTVITADDLPKTTTSADVVYVSTSDTATSDSFTFKVNDGTVDSEAATVSLAITAVNDVPVATAQTDVAAIEQTEVTVTLAGTDLDNDTLSYVIQTLPTNGSLSTRSFSVLNNHENGFGLPIPFNSSNIPFNGTGGATFELSTDPDDSSNKTGKVINSGADWETAEIILDIPIKIVSGEDNKYSVNIYSPDNAVHSILMKLEQSDDNEYIELSKSFQGAGWNTVTFDMSNVTSQAWPNPGANWDGTADFKKLVFFIDGGSSTPGIYHLDNIIKNSESLSLSSSVITSDDLPKTTTSADVVYISTSDTATSDSFTFKVNDGTVDSEAATVSIAITAVNDAPVATAQTDVAATEQTEVTISLVGTDLDSDAITYIVSTLPTNGTLSDNGTVITSDDLPKTTNSSDVVYVSTSDTATSDSFTFKVNDGTVDSEAATVSLAITAVNDVPVATAQTDVAAIEQTEVTVTLAGTDLDNDTLSYVIQTLPTNGTLSDNGTVITADDLPKTTTSSDVVYISTSNTATSDSFTFKVNDGTVDSEAATVSLAITAVNDAPVATAQTDVAATEQTEVTISLAGTDAESDAITYIVSSLPTNGTLSDNGTVITADDLPKTTNSSDVVYVSTSDTATSDSFTFKVNDGTVDSEAATVSIAITAVNDEPTKVNLSSLTIDENAAATEIGTLSTDDLDTNDTFTYELVSGEGDTDNSLFIIDTNKLKNTDAFDFETKSSYSLRIKSTDSGSASVEGIFAITVNNINDIAISSEITSTYCDGSNGTGVITIVTSETIGEVTYSWTGPNGFSSTDQNLKGLESGTYELTVKDDSFEKSIELTVEKTEIFNNLSICYVTSDSEDFTKNRIFLSYQDIYNDKKYEILREGSSAGVYEKIGELNSGETSFLDTSSNSSSSSYSYKVRLLDNCDIVSSESSMHKTILLQSSLATDNSVNLSWTSYEGVSYSTYKIYRRVNNGDFEELTAISSANNSYNDTGADVTQNAYSYYVSIAVESCTTTQKTGLKENLSNNFRYTSRVNETTEIKSNQKFIQDDNADYDNDGVLNSVDICPDSPEGITVDVNGCPVFTLPLDNNKVSVISASCIGNTDGSIGISVEDASYAYSVTVTGKDDPITLGGETKTASVTGLGTGTYTVCFKVDGQDTYEQCFEVNIGEPKALSAFIDVDNDNKTTSIQLSGSSSYNVEVNGQRYDVKGDRFTTNLPTGLSIIKISTDLDCQGIIEREVFISEDIHYYPNPTQTDVNVHVSGEDTMVQVSVFSEKGDLIYTREQQIQDFSRKTNIDLSRQITGTYIVVMDGPTVRKTFKIVKR